MMHDIIKTKLKEIENLYNVRVLFCCEAGSRAWGFSSEDSDYDVRFVYIQSPDWYLSIDQKRDVIEVPIHNMLDMSGWELTKALRLFRKSNPALLEWLQSDIIYQQTYATYHELKVLESKVFSPVSSIYHYLHMAKQNFRKYLQSEEINMKKYMYVLRPVLACKWIEKTLTIPPVTFQDLLHTTVRDGAVKAEITKLLKRKMAEDRLQTGPIIQVLNEFLDSEIMRIYEHVKTMQYKQTDITPLLDSLFRDTLREVWGFNTIF